MPLAPPPVLPADLATALRGRLSPGARLAGGVVSAAAPGDVVAALRLAGRHGVPVGGAAGRGLVVDVDALDEVTVSQAGWARVGGGVRWRRLAEAAARCGVAPVTGPTPAERVADAVTGGGVGPLARTYGPVPDRVRAVELVTGDGVLRRVTAEDAPELFWGVRGGGPGLGVVTAVELDLLAAPTVHAGWLHWAGADAAAVLARWRTWSAALPPQAGTTLLLVRPPSGRDTVAVRFAWTGDPADGAAVLDGLRGAVPPRRDDVVVRRPGDLGTAPVPADGVESSLLLDRLPVAGADALLAAARRCAPRAVELRLLGGAVGWVPERGSALCHREARLAVRVVGGAGAEQRAATWACVEELADVLGPDTGGREAAHGVGPSPDVLARTPTPAVRERLAALAAATDPHRVLEGASRRGPADRSGGPGVRGTG